MSAPDTSWFTAGEPGHWTARRRSETMKDVTGKQIEIHYADEWAALYLDGELVTVGDSYNTEERAFQLLGVATVHDDAFMRGQNQRDGVARTLAEVTEYRTAREQRAAEAARLREEAAALLSQAKALESPNA